MIIKYVNSKGVTVNLNIMPYKMLISDILDYKWTVVKSSNVITGFKKDISTKKVEIDVHASADTDARENESRLFEVFEYDIAAGIPGKLYVDDCYLNCFFYSNSKDNWEAGVMVSCTFGVVTDYPFWITDQKYTFLKQEDDSISELDEANELERGIIVPEFKWDFAKWSDVKRIENKSISASDFVMTIYGYALNPKVMIAGHPYSVEAEILIGERLVIDSKKPSVQKIGRFGEVTNLWNAREKNYSVFQKIPSGYVTMNWTGSFGVDLTIYDERSEPKWSL